MPSTAQAPPEQFCAIIGTRSMLRHTVERAEWLIPPERLVTVVTAGHRPLAADDLVATPPRLLVEQPCNLDTAPGILLPLVPILHRDPDALVAVFPSDHFILEEGRFMAHVALAARGIAAATDRVSLLGITPQRPAPGYGWIEPGSALGIRSLRGVRRFWEKPEAALMPQLVADGCLVNTFVLVASARALWDLTRCWLPELAHGFDRILDAWGTPRQDPVIRQEYAGLRPANFSRAVLEHAVDALAVLAVDGVFWCDWGEPARVVDTLRRIGRSPAWLSRWSLEQEAMPGAV